MKKYLALIVTFLVLCLWTPLALAQGETADPSVASQLLAHLLEITAAVVALLVAWVVKKISGWLNRKTGVETEALLSAWAEKGVNYATEQAHKYLKKTGDRMKGPEKLEQALQFGLMLAEENKLPQAAKDKLVSYIEAKLGADRKAQLAAAEAELRALED